MASRGCTLEFGYTFHLITRLCQNLESPYQNSINPSCIQADRNGSKGQKAADFSCLVKDCFTPKRPIFSFGKRSGLYSLQTFVGFRRITVHNPKESSVKLANFINTVIPISVPQRKPIRQITGYYSTKSIVSDTAAIPAKAHCSSTSGGAPATAAPP